MYYKCIHDDCPAKKTVMKWPEQTVQQGRHEYLVNHDEGVHLAHDNPLEPDAPRHGIDAVPSEDNERRGTGGRPRRPPGPFILWQNEHRKILREQQPHLDMQSVSRMCGTVWRSMSEAEKLPWVRNSEDMKKKIQEEFELAELAEDRQPRPVSHATRHQTTSGYATRGSGPLISGPLEWSVGNVVFVGHGTEVARDGVEMNTLGAPVDNVARELIAEMGIMGNPFKVWSDHNVELPGEEHAAESVQEPESSEDYYEATKRHRERAKQLQDYHGQLRRMERLEARPTVLDDGAARARQAGGEAIQCKYLSLIHI
eukprot:TRINITY_DN2089_c0_g1_i1.p1 TRINITY_DN2089_c0_g1~~TRINITY_DN2089_c0_g1_i1.p1  ORF type:complete len:313 (+),score=55.97 TRINITY_DN2089_c0_g1_i1:213-1151(+)